MKPLINVVWFKRDLRLEDHAALEQASRENLPVLLLFVFEPSLWKDRHTDLRHWRFLYESVVNCYRQFRDRGTRLYLFHRECEEVWMLLAEQFRINTVYSYEETGLEVTYRRDHRLARWFADCEISWVEFPCNGVQRRRLNRDGWDKQWKSQMSQPQHQVDWSGWQGVELDSRWYAEQKGPQLPIGVNQKHSNFQTGGEEHAQLALHQFLKGGGHGYSRHISKPLTSPLHTSRLSPYRLTVACQCGKYGRHFSRSNIPAIPFELLVLACTGIVTSFKSLRPNQILSSKISIQAILVSPGKTMSSTCRLGKTGTPVFPW